VATKKVKIKVGLFLLVCFSLIGAAVAYISGAYASQGVSYWLEFTDSVFGVYEGGVVQYLGVPVGKVSNISVTPSNAAHIEILIDPAKIELQRGVEGQLVLYSLAAGTMAIELSGGNPAEGPLPPDSQIPARPSAFAAISTKLEEVVNTVLSLLEKVEEGMEGLEEGTFTEMIKSAKNSLAEVETLTKELTETVETTNSVIAKVDEKVEPVTEEILALSKNLRATSEDAGEFLRVATSKAEALDVKSLGSKVDQVLQEISGLTVQLQSSVQNLDESSASMLFQADNVEFTLRTTLQNTSDTLLTLESLLTQVKQDPSSLVRGKGKVKE
jgi:phospholipid/cholesterol/gamma-HCH transport system substrate-binding protein